MKFLNKLERKFGRYAIRNLSLYMIVGYVVGYLFNMMGVMSFFTFNPSLIMRGQIWRLVTWVITPPQSLSIFTVIMLLFYYSVGTSLERTWGAFRYNVYIFSGMLFTVVGVMILYGVSTVLNFSVNIDYVSAYFDYVSTYFLCMSIFLAYAVEYPNMYVMLYGIIPVKVKWMAYLDVAYLLFMIYASDWVTRIVILCCLLNFIVLFLATRNYKKISPSEIKRKHNYKQQIRTAKSMAVHKCAVCGQTSETNEELQFRYCSKCNGNYEYCQNHLFTHKHVQ